jgi:hypothetical protein
MKITRVKVDGKRVRINRATQESFLTYEGQSDNKTKEVLNDEERKKALKKSLEKKKNPNKDIGKRIERLEKSIKNNVLVSGKDEENLSKRKWVLLQYAKQLKKDGGIDLSDVSELYGIGRLAEELKDAIAEKTTKGRNVVIKEKLEEHRRGVFKDKQENIDNAELQIYRNEIAKYIQHYFPIADSKNKRKEKRKDDENYYNYYLNADTIKKTIKKQLENAVRLFQLSEGRIKHKNISPENLNSQTLSEHKRKEGFVLNLINACAFAANNIRNIVYPQQTKDILGRNEFKRSLNETTDKQLFKQFYDADLNSKDQTLWAMRGAVQQIRNNVFHFKTDAIKKIFNIETFKFPVKHFEICHQYEKTLFQQCLKTDKDNIKKTFAESLINLSSVYESETIINILQQSEFSLCRSSLPFTPSFKKVFERGENLKLPNYLNTNTENKEQKEQRRFFMKEIYNNIFLAEFTKNKTKFAEIVSDILKKNKEKHKYKTAFKDIEEMGDESIKAYMAYVQSGFMLQESLEKERNNFEKFLIDIFVYGFDQKLGNYHNDLCQVKTELLNGNKRTEWIENISEEIKVSIESIDENNPSHIAFYTFCKLLDKSHLSSLRNEFIKFRQTGGHLNKNSDDYKHLLEIIELCLLNADMVKQEYKYNNNDISPFIIEETENYGTLYNQEGNNKEDLIVHSNIVLAKKYGTGQRLKELIAPNDCFKVSIEDYNNWNNLKGKIEKLHTQRDELHKNWVETQKKFNKQKQYKECIEVIANYDWLDNKLHLVHIRKLHNLLIEILGRMVGFVALFDRDFNYMAIQCGYDYSEGLPDVTNRNPPRKGATYCPLLFSSGFLPKKELPAPINDYYKNFRNFVAHLNYMTHDTPKYSLLDMINGLRSLLKYDHKLRNAVSSSIIEIFKKHKMILTFQYNPNDHTLYCPQIESDKIEHLKDKRKHLKKTKIDGKSIETDAVSQEFCCMCKALLTMKNIPSKK